MGKKKSKLRSMKQSKKVNKTERKGIFVGMTLKSRMILFLLLFTLIPSLIIGNVVYFVSSSTIENKVSSMNDEIGKQVTKNVNNALKEFENITLVPFSNMDIMENLKDDEGLTQFEIFNKQREITEYFSSITFSNKNAIGMLFVNEEGTLYGETNGTKEFDLDTFLNSEIPEKVKELSGSIYWGSGIDDSYDTVYLFREFKRIGTLVLMADNKLFNTVLDVEEKNTGREISVINSEGITIASNNGKLVGTKYESQDSEHYLVSSSESYNGWQVSVSTSKDFLMKEINNVIYIVYAIIGGFVILSVFVSFLLARGMIKPIHQIVDIMKEAENGDLTHRATYLYRNEVGQLGQSFNNMIDNMTIMIEENKKVSNYAVKSAADLKRIAEESASATEQIASAIEEVAKGAVSQVDYSERTNREMKDLSSEINDVAHNMEKVQTITETTKQLSSQSIETINDLTGKNEEMGTNIGQVDNTMKALNQEIEQIKDIVEMIKSVSEETNLLSLNASIEAARAGAAGRGFSVVAEEIRKLADQTKNSSLRIETVIANILNQTKKSVDLVKTTILLFKEQTDSIHDTKEAFENILEGTNSIISEIDYVEASIGRITQNKEKVEIAINEMVEVAEASSATTEEVTATTEEQSASAEELGDLAASLSGTIQELEQMINKFKI
ncbi:methyl-accepting chemotaxis protein [Metabacillus malikii]|uniref:Methyl-accepting chemotaxis protein n=1 Tax=Metabacillus malikii TaxID=1504265 RepID=A0ABT9ZBK0_9BACI|nr:methyl-accepting chemotaxis protein [Metabacillus malikii]MDQ0229645.1 methyl-accepting chemotaxis protein [Metabacillus malikii]